MKRQDLYSRRPGCKQSWVWRAILIVALAISAGSCKFAVKHPAVTAGIAAGTVALGTCELASSEHAKCFGISGAGGVGIALLTALALWLGYEDETGSPAQGGSGKDPVGIDPTNLAPAPVFLPKPLATPDAGVAPPPPDAAPVIDAGIDAP